MAITIHFPIRTWAPMGNRGAIMMIIMTGTGMDSTKITETGCPACLKTCASGGRRAGKTSRMSCVTSARLCVIRARTSGKVCRICFRASAIPACGTTDGMASTIASPSGNTGAPAPGAMMARGRSGAACCAAAADVRQRFPLPSCGRHGPNERQLSPVYLVFKNG